MKNTSKILFFALLWGCTQLFAQPKPIIIVPKQPIPAKQPVKRKSTISKPTVTVPDIELVYISGGTFIMGSPTSESERCSNETQHRVTVSSFKMGKYEVTFSQYDDFCNATGRSKPSDEGWGRGNRSVINVSWDDAVAFCSWLSNASGTRYRLPTEAEWEYACRAVTTTTFNTGNNLTTNYANYNGNYTYNGNSKGEYRQQTLPVGSFSSNAWGLYDMHGNVYEWCIDWYGDYPSSAQTNPTGASTGAYRVYRGGSWLSLAYDCRSAGRNRNSPGHCFNYMGFRLVSSSK